MLYSGKLSTTKPQEPRDQKDRTQSLLRTAVLQEGSTKVKGSTGTSWQRSGRVSCYRGSKDPDSSMTPCKAYS